MEFSIRRGEPRDASAIAAFNQSLARETEGKELDHATVGRGVERVFADPAKGFYLVAEREGIVVGQLMVTYEWSDWRDGWIWWIQSVYVHQDARRLGVFRALYEAVCQKGRQQGNVVGIRLYVEKENLRAQKTYENLGMEDAGYYVREMLL
jgi:ribosomal protein S18 acetylase RimI-like enzyme